MSYTYLLNNKTNRGDKLTSSTYLILNCKSYNDKKQFY